MNGLFLIPFRGNLSHTTFRFTMFMVFYWNLFNGFFLRFDAYRAFESAFDQERFLAGELSPSPLLTEKIEVTP